MTNPTNLPKSKWYHSVSFVLLSLFLILGPLGLPLLWNSSRFSKWAKIGLTVAVAVYTLALVQAMRALFQTAMGHLDQIKQLDGIY